MKEKIQEKEKAIPSPIIVKGQILEAYSEASINLAKYLRNMQKKRLFEDFKAWIRDLFFWLEIKIDFKNKNYKCLEKLQKWIREPNGTKLEYNDWIDFWYALRFKVEELEITKIEMEEEDLATAFLR